jgi:hypothetical protein
MRVIGLDAGVATQVGEREIETQDDAMQGLHGDYHPLLQPVGQCVASRQWVRPMLRLARRVCDVMPRGALSERASTPRSAHALRPQRVFCDEMKAKSRERERLAQWSAYC